MASEPVERFAAEAEDARLRIADTIDAIQDRLDPRRIVGDAVDRVSGSSVRFASEAREMAKSHPLAIGAAVAAIGVALLARTKLANATVDLGDNLRDYTDYDDGFGYVERGSSRHSVEGVDEKDAADGARAAKAAAHARVLAARAAGSVATNPLVSIVIGLAAGAALGALFPATEAERRALAATGRVGATARDTAAG